MLQLHADNLQARFERNIRQFFLSATSEETVNGMKWYEEAHGLAVEMANNSRFTVAECVAIIAILSPMLSWGKNVEYAKFFAATLSTVKPNGKNLHTARVCAKLEKIAARIGDTPSDENLVYIIQENYGIMGKRGPLKCGLPSKTTNFFLNIWNYAKCGSVTIDAHASGAAFGDFISNYEDRGVAALKYYNEMAEAYKTVAAQYGMLGHQMQAIVWLSYRRQLAKHRKGV